MSVPRSRAALTAGLLVGADAICADDAGGPLLRQKDGRTGPAALSSRSRGSATASGRHIGRSTFPRGAN
ncbi:hypothetical protein ACFYZ3_02375 [Streptomyces sp. NPDC001599]|uniref:hypothetical protein n=1 Tax=Streptomyces sp. NPDC001599 TaxID=3364591 RepID=UPI0036ADAF05